MSDKRRCHRLSFELPLSLDMTGRDHTLSVATTLDVSGLGLRITTRQALMKGQEIKVHLRVSDKEKIVVKAKVMWVKEEEMGNIKEYSAGLKILDAMECEESKFLKFFAQKFLDFFKKP